MKITAETIASMCGGRIEGDKDCEITGFAKIEEAKEGDISFIANPKYSHFASATHASVLLVRNDFIAPEGTQATLVRVEDPYSTLAKLLSAFAPQHKKTGIEAQARVAQSAQIGDDVFIGAFAYVSDGAKIGRGTIIYPHAFIGENVEIGEDCIIYPHVTIYDGCKVGNRCIIHSGTVVGSDGFGFAPEGEEYRKIPQIGIVVIEDDVEIGANTTIDRATMGMTLIERGTKLDNLIQVAHNVRIGRNNVIAAQTGIAGSTRIGNSNRIGGQVGFAGHIKFGSYCEVGAQSGINKGYRDHSRIIGYPATDIETFARNTVLLKRLSSLFNEVDNIKKEIKKIQDTK